MSLLGAAVAGLGVLALVLSPPAGAALSSIPDPTVAVNGSVLAIAHTSTRTYIGGNFAYVGTPTIGSGGVSTTTGLLQNFARVTAGTSLSAVISDGAGGFYIGGTFTAVGGQPATNLAHINADGSVDTNFAANPNGLVTALTLSGGSLFVAGSFTSIGGQAVAGLAKLDATTGTASATFNPAPSGAVNVLLVSGTALYAGGSFETVGGQSATPNLVQLDTTTGSVDTAFVPAPNGAVNALAQVGNLLFAGGSFSSIGAQNATPNLAQLDATTGAVNTAFAPAPNGAVNALAVNADASVVYVGGGFFSLGGQARLAKVNRDTTTSASTLDPNWAPFTGNTIYSLALSGGALYVGGNFGAIGTSTQVSNADLAKLDPTTGVVDLTFKPVPASTVTTFAVSGSSIYAGGAFPLINAVHTNGLASIKPDGSIDRTFVSGMTSGAVVQALAASGSSLYVGGTFNAIGGGSMVNLARVDAGTGALDTTWNPAIVNGVVDALALSGTTLFASGVFQSIGGQAATPRLAKLNTTATTTAATVDTTWQPAPNIGPLALALVGTTLYAGGAFTTIGTETTTPHLAKLNTTVSGTSATVDTSFAPAPGNTVYALAYLNGALYVGGTFTTMGIGGVTVPATTRLAQLNATTGAVDTGFAPAPNNAVLALWPTSSALYAGGTFTAIGTSGQTATPRLTKLDLVTGAVDTTFAPARNNTVSALTAFGGTLYAGGNFTQAAIREGFAQFSDPVAPIITFTTPVPSGATAGDSFTVAATGGGSSAPVTFSIDALSGIGTCTISGAVVSDTGVGTCLVDADQAADGSYATAAEAQQSFTIAPAPVVSASLTPSTFTYDAASAGTSSQAQSETFTLTNTGNQSIDTQAPALTGDDPDDYVIDSVSCAATLTPGDMCIYVVEFAPGTADASADTSAQLNVGYAYGAMGAETATSILSGHVNPVAVGPVTTPSPTPTPTTTTTTTTTPTPTNATTTPTASAILGQIAAPPRATGQSAVVSATIPAHSSAVRYRFAYGASARYGARTSGRTLAASSTGTAVTAKIAHLVPGRVYHYRLEVTTAIGAVTDGRDATLYTPRAQAQRVRDQIDPFWAQQAPYAYTVTGQVILLDHLADAVACQTQGQATITAMRGDTVLARHTVKLTEACGYSSAFSFTASQLTGSGRLGFHMRFSGNQQLRARRARTLNVFYGPDPR